MSSHRVNYASGMDVGNRDRNLVLLNQLLKSIVTTWPDVEFLSSDELLAVMTD